MIQNVWRILKGKWHSYYRNDINLSQVVDKEVPIVNREFKLMSTFHDGKEELPSNPVSKLFTYTAGGWFGPTQCTLSKIAYYKDYFLNHFHNHRKCCYNFHTSNSRNDAIITILIMMIMIIIIIVDIITIMIAPLSHCIAISIPLGSE